MFNFFKKKKYVKKSVYDCRECTSGKYRRIDKSKEDDNCAHFYRCDVCGNKIIINPVKKHS